MTVFTDTSELEQARQIFRDKKAAPDGRLSGCTSYLQRHLECSYNHGSAIMLELEREDKSFRRAVYPATDRRRGGRCGFEEQTDEEKEGGESFHRREVMVNGNDASVPGS